MTLPSVCVVGPLTGRLRKGIPTQGEFLAEQLALAGFPVRAVSFSNNRYLRVLDVFQTIIRHRKTIDLHLVQVFSGRGFAMAGLVTYLARRLGHKTILILRGGSLPDFARQRKPQVARVFRRADHVVAPSTYLQRELSWLKEGIILIPNAINLQQYPFHPRFKAAPRVLWMRAFHEIYNPEMAVDVADILRRDYPDLQLSMGGPDLGKLKAIDRLIESKGIQANVKILGFLNWDAKLRAANAHDIYINTNVVDNQPVSVIEMAAFGLPVVSTRVGGIVDLLQPGKNALLVPSNDAPAMAAAVQQLFLEPSLVERLSGAGRQLAESFSWESVAPMWKTLLLSA